MLLKNLEWKCTYSPADGNLIQKFYIPLLKCARTYDRTTGFYSARTLAAASAGVEALVKNGGKMRLLAGCTLERPEIEAISLGQSLADTIEARLLASPFDVSDSHVRSSLELLAWMVAKKYLEIRVAVPCEPQSRHPLPGAGIFHYKCGLVTDRAGDRLVFSGSLNETLAAWQSRNWDAFHVFCSWQKDADHLIADEQMFQKLWANEDPWAQVFEISEAVKKQLLQFLPEKLPSRIAPKFEQPAEASPIEIYNPASDTWRFLANAAKEEPEGKWVGLATAAVEPWAHQEQAFLRMYENWPPRLMIADEVGLGKTIQAGMLVRQAWLAGKARRILIMAPKAVLWQWQLELREKFNLNFPIYDKGQLHWYPSPVLKGAHIQPVGEQDWHKQPFLLVSSQLMRLPKRAKQLLEEAEEWDLLILDEAHHARRKGNAGDNLRDEPNQLLRLMRKLEHRTRGLLLLTATPMQINPVEVWDLLNLLGLPNGWTAAKFLQFFGDTVHQSPDNRIMEGTSALFREMEEYFGPLTEAQAGKIAPENSRFGLNKILKALRCKDSHTPIHRLSVDERRTALKLMRQHNPIRLLVSRHTRELLRKYRKAGILGSNIASRRVEDVKVELSGPERAIYDAVEDYILATYNKASAKTRTSTGFVMTIYRRRLASSFHALRQTLLGRLAQLDGAKPLFNNEDMPQDELDVEAMDDGEKASREALKAEEKAEIRYLVEQIEKLPTDSKAKRLFEKIAELEAGGYKQAIVFTQFTDTLDFLRSELIRANPKAQVICFSGRGGERWQNGEWQKVSRDKVKEIFRQGRAKIMLCTDAAAEGLNFQFCGALLNYDMPWNPMRVEQRIGRIDRLGQKYADIRISNFMYANTVEADIFTALAQRISLFSVFVGRLQPILARLPKAFEAITLNGGDRAQKVDQTLADLSAAMDQQADFDLDSIADSELTAVAPKRPPYDLAYLRDILENPALLPPGYKAEALSEHKDYKYCLPGKNKPVRVTCDREFYSEHAESVELWSPGSPAFPPLPE